MSELDPILETLNRIAAALEEQNRFHTTWMQLQTKWHDEAETLTEKRYQEHVTLQEKEVKRDEAWRERHLGVVEAQARLQNDGFQAAYEGYLDALKKGEFKP